MKRKPPVTRIIITGLILFIITVTLLESLLRIVDPFGVIAHRYIARWSQTHQIAHPTGQHYMTGVYQVGDHTITIDETGNRYNPDSGADCHVAMIGDSVTFGYGVSDHETFAYILAERLPQARIRNLGHPGYNQSNISDLAAYYPSDVYVYLIVGNDNQERSEVTTKPLSRWYQPVIGEYLLYIWLDKQAPTPFDNRAFRDMMHALSTYNMLYFSLDDIELHTIASEYADVVLLPETERISFRDRHPTAYGHQVIADTIQPYLEDAIRATCGGAS